MEGIILAAGKSSRYKRNKMLETFKTSTVLEETIKSMASVCHQIYVITGHYTYDFNIASVEFVKNENYQEGMYTSVQKGVECVQGDEVFIIPGDMPLVDPSIYYALLDEKGDVVLPSFQMKSGHPIKITRKVIEDILKTNHVTLRDILNTYDKKYVSVEDETILMDIDRQEDYKEMIRRLI